MFLRLISDIWVRSSMKRFPKCFSLSLHSAGQKQRRCSTVSYSSLFLQLLQKLLFVAFGLAACVPTIQRPVRARTCMPLSVRLNLSTSEVFYCLSQAMSGKRYDTVMRFTNECWLVS